MHKPFLNILIVGFSESQHAALVVDFQRFDGALRLNTKPLSAPELKKVLRKTPVDGIFIKRKSSTRIDKLYPALQKNNPDCIAVELLEAPVSLETVQSKSELQRCHIVFDRTRTEFYLAIQFVLQYTRLKIDFRRCKSLLYLSEKRTSNLVNSSSVAIAYLYQGKFLHANIPFLVLFNADSIEELKRFSLLKIMDESERKMFANYLTEVKQAPHLNVGLTLTLKRISGAPFYAKVNVSPLVVRGKHCYQMWVEKHPKDSKPEVIPIAKSLNIWDMPMESAEVVGFNPFDDVFNKSTEGKHKETKVDVMLDALQHDGTVKLRFRELYIVGERFLNRVWIDLDVIPDEFKKINSLLAKIPEVTSNPPAYANFWDQLLFRMICDELLHESSSDRTYMVDLSGNMMAASETMQCLYKMLKVLKEKSIQLMLLIDANVSMSRIPHTQKVIELLRGCGCQIALNNFSVDTTPLFLYRKVQPEAVILDSQWLDVLKEKEDGDVFLSRFVQQIEGRGVSVIIPHAIQKSNGKLLVLSSSSFGQEKTTQDCA